MSWLAIVAQVVAFLLPYLQKWIEELLKDAARDMAGKPDDALAGEQMGLLFDRAAGRLSWWQWRRRGRLALARRLAVGRAAELFAAVRLGTDGPVLSDDEQRRMREAMGN
jgi:hypothetical protein